MMLCIGRLWSGHVRKATPDIIWVLFMNLRPPKDQVHGGFGDGKANGMET